MAALPSLTELARHVDALPASTHVLDDKADPWADEWDESLDDDFLEALDDTTWEQLDPTSSKLPSSETAAPATADALDTAAAAPCAALGFQKANGKRLARPSAAAMAEAAKRLKLDVDDGDIHAAPRARGAAVPAPLETPFDAGPPSHALPSSTPSASAPTQPPLHSSPTFVSPRAVLSQHGTHDTVRAPSCPEPSMIPQFGCFLASAAAALTQATPPRTPTPRASTARRRGSTPRWSASRPSTSALTPALTPGRKPLSLGMTPRGSRAGASPRTGAFTPPFKKAAPPPSSQPRARAPSPEFEVPSDAPRRESPSPPPRRVVSAPKWSYRAAGLVPRRRSVADARRDGVPPEVCAILADPGMAAQYAFAVDGAVCGAVEAYASLQATHGVLVTKAWVLQHYALILWKLAGYVAHAPERLSTDWRFDVVLAQLEHRFHRETVLRQYSAVKRIQEQCLAPTSRRPVVLCVHQVIRFAAAEDTDGADSVMLQLTDGWYKIRADIDAPLRRALERGALRPGHKLAISTAKVGGTTHRSCARTRTAHLCWTRCTRLICGSLPTRRSSRAGTPSSVSSAIRLSRVSRDWCRTAARSVSWTSWWTRCFRAATSRAR